MGMQNKRKPIHPGIILDEHYIKPLKLNLDELAQRLGISRNTLFKLRVAKASLTPSLAISLAEAFETSPQMWLNLQQKHDLWIAEHGKKRLHVMQIIKNGVFLEMPYNLGLRKAVSMG